jgi:hypothetical protein
MEGSRDHIEAFPDAESRRRTVANAIDGSAKFGTVLLLCKIRDLAPSRVCLA